MPPATTWWIGRIVDDELHPDELVELPVTGNRRGTTGAAAQLGAVLEAAEKSKDVDIGKGNDWSLVIGDADGPDREIAYHVHEHPNVLFICDATHWEYLRNVGQVGGSSKFTLDLRPSPQLLMATWKQPDRGHYATRKCSGFRDCEYPGELTNLADFADASYGNDITGSVVFSIGSVPYVLWIYPARHFARGAEQRDMVSSVYELETLRRGTTIRDALDDKQPNETILSTDDPAELMAEIDRLYNAYAASVRSRAAAAGAQALSPDRKLLEEFAKLTYRGWAFRIPSRAAHQLSAIGEHPDGDHKVEVHLFSDRPEIAVEVMELAAPGYPIAQKTLPFPKLGRSAEGLLGLVRHTLDEWQPVPPEIDETAARFGQMELEGARHRAEDLPPEHDESAQRFRLLELNPRRRGNPPAVHRIQKVVSKLEKAPAPKVTRGGYATDPDVVVKVTLADYLAEKPTETFLVLHLNMQNQIIGYTEYNEGAPASVGVHPNGIFQDALGIGSVAILTCHNHPSGSAHPSEEDRALWERLRQAGRLIGIPVVDNMIVGDGQYYSEAMDARLPIPSRVQYRAAAEKRKASP